MDENIFMLWFSLIKNLSLKQKHLVLNAFLDVKDIYNAKENDFKNLDILNNKIISSIISSQNLNDVLSYKSRLDNLGISFITINDDKYPSLLKNIYEPPIVLYYIGRLPEDFETLVAIVGTRKPSSYGESVTYNITKILSKENIGIVSGLAYGVDTIAHSVTLENNGYTIAVVATGLDICYPTSNLALMKKIAENGLILSEYPLETRAEKHHFPMRNRIIAGLCNTTIVTCAPLKSGALITANLALDEGRDVLTVPANIFDKNTEGNNRLIREGAVPITCLDDVLCNINYTVKTSDFLINPLNEQEEEKYENLTDNEKIIIKNITSDGTSIDELINTTGLTAQIILSSLTILEVNDIIKKLSNHKFIKIM